MQVPLKGKVNEHGLTWWEANRYAALDVALNYIPRHNGMIAQFGVASGQSAQWILDMLKNWAIQSHPTQLFLFDSFEGLPEDWTSKFKKGHFACEVPEFNDTRVEIIKGWFHEIDPKFFDISYGLVHMDADLYSSTKYVLDRIKVFPGQIFVFDEIFGVPNCEEQEAKAFNEWVQEKGITYTELFRSDYSQLVIRIDGIGI